MQSVKEICDIVIPVWNHLDETRECVESIEKHTHYPYRLIIIDNASDDLTKNYLENLKTLNPKKNIVLRNEKNNGFVKAVNQGIKFSDALYVCIMNNDTIATDGWLKELIDILKKNKNIGIINPSSNTSCQFPGKLDIDSYADTLKKFKGQYQELYTCRAFSMVVKREVIERAGYLDEIYGMGYFDDTDYCKRAQSLNYMTVRAKASYVYHKESQSFSKIKERSEIFTENEKKFFEKWGRCLKVAYLLPYLQGEERAGEMADTINKIAKIGHQVWIFTKPEIKPKLKLIDHESIRFYCYPRLFFRWIVLYKIWKRKYNKKLDIVLTNDSFLLKLFRFFGKKLEAEVLADKQGTFPKGTPYFSEEIFKKYRVSP